MPVHTRRHTYIPRTNEGDEKEERLVRNSDDSQGGGYYAGCGFRTTGSSRGTFMGQDSHRSGQNRAVDLATDSLIESRAVRLLQWRRFFFSHCRRFNIKRDESATSWSLSRENLVSRYRHPVTRRGSRGVNSSIISRNRLFPVSPKNNVLKGPVYFKKPKNRFFYIFLKDDVWRMSFNFYWKIRKIGGVIDFDGMVVSKWACFCQYIFGYNKPKWNLKN